MKNREVWTILVVLISFIYVYAEGETEAGVSTVTIVRVEPLTQTQYDTTLADLNSRSTTVVQQAQDVQTETGVQQSSASQTPITPEIIAAFQSMDPSANTNYFNPSNTNDATTLASINSAYQALGQSPPASQTYTVSAGSINRDFTDMGFTIVPQGATSVGGIYGYYYSTSTPTGTDLLDSGLTVHQSEFGNDDEVDAQTRSIIVDLMRIAHNIDPSITTIGAPVANTGGAAPTGGACPTR